MSFPKRMIPAALCAALFVHAGPAQAAKARTFSYKASYRQVTADPDGVWPQAELSPGPRGTVTIHEYELTSTRGTWLVSQIWNADCAAATCPTRLVDIASDGHRRTLVDDMMHQIIPPDDPRFITNGAAAAFARAPFALSADDKTLINGDFRFALTGNGR